MARDRFVPRFECVEERLTPAVFTPGVITPPSDFFGGTSLLIDFDRDATGAVLPADTPISDQYASLGVRFSLRGRQDFPATSTRNIVDAVSTPNSLYVKQNERTAAATTIVTFDPGVRNPLPTAVGFVFTDGPPGGFAVRAYNAAGAVVDQATIDTANTSFVPLPGDTEDTFIGLRSDGGIARLEFNAARVNSQGVVGYEIDNLRFNTPGQPLPPPPPGGGPGTPAPGVRPPDLAVATAGPNAPVYRVGANDQLTAVDGLPGQPFGGAGTVRAATGDVNGDGSTDVVYVTGPGTGTRQFIRVVSGKDGSDLIAGGVFDPFGPAEPVVNMGLFVDVADVTADGRADIIITPDEGGGPRVQIFSLNGNTLSRVANFFGIDDTRFLGGARIAAGNFDGDEFTDLVVAAGFGGGPRVAVFKGETLRNARPERFFGDFIIFEVGLRDGVFVAAGDLDADGVDELVFGGGPGGGPRVQVVRFNALLNDPNKRDSVDPRNSYANFFAFDFNQRGGVRVAVKRVDGEDRADLLVGSGQGANARAQLYRGTALSGGPSATQTIDLFGAPALSTGVFVG